MIALGGIAVALALASCATTMQADGGVHSFTQLIHVTLNPAAEVGARAYSHNFPVVQGNYFGGYLTVLCESVSAEGPPGGPPAGYLAEFRLRNHVTIASSGTPVAIKNVVIDSEHPRTAADGARRWAWTSQAVWNPNAQAFVSYPIDSGANNNTMPLGNLAAGGLSEKWQMGWYKVGVHNDDLGFEIYVDFTD